MTQPFDDSRYRYLPGERGWIAPTLLAVEVAFLLVTVLVLVLAPEGGYDGGLVAVLVVVNVLVAGCVGWEFLKRRAYLRDRRNGNVIDRTPDRPTGHGDHESPNLAD